MSSIATVTSKGQVTLPAAIRRALGVDAGDKVSFSVESSHVVVRPVPDFLSLAGSVPVPPDVRGLDWPQIRATAYQRSVRP